jgi:hypothetical protein
VFVKLKILSFGSYSVFICILTPVYLSQKSNQSDLHFLFCLKISNTALRTVYLASGCHINYAVGHFFASTFFLCYMLGYHVSTFAT